MSPKANLEENWGSGGNKIHWFLWGQSSRARYDTVRIGYASCEIYCWYDIWDESKSGYDCYFCLKVFIDNLDGNQWPKAILQYPAGLWMKVQYISLPNFIIFTFEMWSANSIWLHKSKQLKNKRFPPRGQR